MQIALCERKELLQSKQSIFSLFSSASEMKTQIILPKSMPKTQLQGITYHRQEHISNLEIIIFVTVGN